MKKKFPRGGIRKNAQEFVDADYLHTLSEKDRAWYDSFIQAEYGANREAAKKIKGGALTTAEKKTLDLTNNGRRRDAYNRLDRTIQAEKALVNKEVNEDNENE